VDDFSVATQMVLKAFDAGICHFDLANNYGPEPGSAETNFGRILKENLASHRDELFISSKAGHDMWPGVYGGNSSRKNLIASCDQSLKRTGLDYFDIFYSHRYDGVTPIEETMQALIDLVRQGKALYVGISKYPPELQQRCYDILKEAHVPCLLSQYRCSMFDPKAKNNNFQIASDNGSGIICFSPLAQGLLTGKYDNGIPAGSRASKSTGFLQESQVTPERVEAVKKLALIAKERRQSMAQMALAWVLADERVTSCIIGTSSVAQLENNLETLQNLTFSAEEMEHINNIISNPSLWF
jgi:L-glyceraldehyde 3-phosphate reductase